MKFLFAPAHYDLYDSSGSEKYWAGEILKVCADNKIGAVAFCKNNRLQRKLPGVEVRELPTNNPFSFLNQFIFHYHIYREGKKLLAKGEFNLVHHILPFGYQATFNLLALRKKIVPRPFIWGPFPGYSEENISKDAKSFSYSYGEKISAPSFFLFRFLFSIAKPLLKYLFRKTIESADQVLVTLNHDAKLLREKYKIKNIYKVNLFVDTKMFCPQAAVKVNPKEILYIGNINKRMGVEALVAAFSQIFKQDPEVILRIIGSPGDASESLDKLKKAYPHNVIVEGFVPHDQLAGPINRAAVFCLPTYYGGINVCLEAMACAKPVVVGISPGMLELIQDGQTGFICQPDKTEELVEKIFKLLNDPDLQQKLGQQAYQFIIKNHTREVFARQILSLYQKVIS